MSTSETPLFTNISRSISKFSKSRIFVSITYVTCVSRPRSSDISETRHVQDSPIVSLNWPQSKPIVDRFSERFGTYFKIKFLVPIVTKYGLFTRRSSDISATTHVETKLFFALKLTWAKLVFHRFSDVLVAFFKISFYMSQNQKWSVFNVIPFTAPKLSVMNPRRSDR